MKRFFSRLFNFHYDPEIDAIADERAYQKAIYSAEHDDRHVNGELAENAFDLLFVYHAPCFKGRFHLGMSGGWRGSTGMTRKSYFASPGRWSRRN